MKKPLPLKPFDRDAAVARSISEGSARLPAEETAFSGGKLNRVRQKRKKKKRKKKAVLVFVKPSLGTLSFYLLFDVDAVK